jgi:phosphoribosylaminoimidazolecarboxamide formyltransferase/IMP cyclohydrolase
MIIRRALLSVSDKDGIVELGKALQSGGTELVATGRTAKILEEAGLKVTPIETISGSPEAFQGRMKTLSFPVCSGILYRRGDASDEQDLQKLNVKPLDCVVVNFYPFEKAAAQAGKPRKELIEEVDIGGPTLVRAAAKNSPDVLVLTSPLQYQQVIQELRETGTVHPDTVETCAQSAWDRVLEYDSAIAKELGRKRLGILEKTRLRYGENPHQVGSLEFDPQGPVDWKHPLTSNELSYNNILDLSSAYALMSELVQAFPHSTGVLIVKHNNPCGVAFVPRSTPNAQELALKYAWEGDPVSAFGGVVVLTDPLGREVAEKLGQNFVELIAAPHLHETQAELQQIVSKRKKLKAISIRRWGEVPTESVVAVPGGRLCQTADTGIEKNFRCVTQIQWPEEKKKLAQFGVAVCRSLKSNAIAIVREVQSNSEIFQLIGAGQGQPNRVDALQALAVPRAQNILSISGGLLSECVMISDAFFPFRDTVDVAFEAGIRWIVQPGGSLKDQESIAACDEHSMGMVFTGVRHFKH